MTTLKTTAKRKVKMVIPYVFDQARYQQAVLIECQENPEGLNAGKVLLPKNQEFKKATKNQKQRVLQDLMEKNLLAKQQKGKTVLYFITSEGCRHLPLENRAKILQAEIENLEQALGNCHNQINHLFPQEVNPIFSSLIQELQEKQKQIGEYGQKMMAELQSYLQTIGALAQFASVLQQMQSQFSKTQEELVNFSNQKNQELQEQLQRQSVTQQKRIDELDKKLCDLKILAQAFSAGSTYPEQPKRDLVHQVIEHRRQHDNKSTPILQLSETKIRMELKKAYDRVKARYDAHLLIDPSLPELYYEALPYLSGLAIEQFHQVLKKLVREDLIYMFHSNDSNVPEPKFQIQPERYYYVKWREG